MDDLVEALQTATLPAQVPSLLSSDLTFHQLKVLTVLGTSSRGAAVQDLADTFGVTLASMSTMLDRLVAQEAAIRVVDNDDQRVRRVEATDSGRDIVQRLVGWGASGVRLAHPVAFGA